MFIPQTLTPAVTAVVWKRIYAPDGPVNDVLKAVGLGHLATGWLGDFTWALPAIGLIGTWAAFGLCVLMFISGMQGIPTDSTTRCGSTAPARCASSSPSRCRACAGRSRRAHADPDRRDPAVRPRLADHPGRPGHLDHHPDGVLYERAFANPEVGSAAAIGVVLTIVSLLVVLVIVKLAEGSVDMISRRERV